MSINFIAEQLPKHPTSIRREIKRNSQKRGGYSAKYATMIADDRKDRFDETDDVTVGRMWRLTKKVNTRIEPFLIGMKKFKEDKTSPLLSTIKQNGLEIK